MPTGVLAAMWIRRLPSGAFQVRFQLDGVSHTASYPTRDMAEEAELLMRAAALAHRQPTTEVDGRDNVDAFPRVPAHHQRPSIREVWRSSRAASAVIDAALGGLPGEGSSAAAIEDEVLTTTEAARLLGVSRPTLVTWLEAGRIPFQRRGSHRRIRRSDLDAYRKQTP